MEGTTLLLLGSELSRMRIAEDKAQKQTLNLPVTDKEREFEATLKVLQADLDKSFKAYEAYLI